MGSKEYSEAEQQKIQNEVDELNQSKEKLAEYEELESEIKVLKEEQEQLRDKKKWLFQQMGSIKSREKTIALLQRSQSSESPRPLHAMSEKEMGEYRAKLRQEMDELTKASSRLTQEFKRRENEYLAMWDKEKKKMQEEKEKKVEEKKLKEVERKSREVYKRVEGVSDSSLMEVTKGRSACWSLIAHLERNYKSPKTDTPEAGLLVPGDGSDDRSGTSSDQSDDRRQKPQDWEERDGVFLKKKQEEEYFMPRQAQKKKSKKEKQKQSMVKASKPLLHSPLMLEQFTFLGLVPPRTLKDVPGTLETLKRKLVSLEEHLRSSVQADVIGGVDSGIMSVEHSDSEFTGF
jgi:hypothetical protein